MVEYIIKTMTVFFQSRLKFGILKKFQDDVLQKNK